VSWLFFSVLVSAFYPRPEFHRFELARRDCCK
jgi:hypothetical protein